MDKAQAAQTLGMAEREIVSVQGSKPGPIIQTLDGNAYIVCDKPDGNGHTGVMYLVPPHPKYDPAKNLLPVFRSGKPGATRSPAPSDLTAEQQWRAQQLEQIADGLNVELDTHTVHSSDPLADASVEALVTDAGPQPEKAEAAEPITDGDVEEATGKAPARRQRKAADS